PDLATTADVASQGDTRGLDLPVGDVRRLERLDPVLTEGHAVAALALAVPARVVRLAEALRWLAGHQHGSALLALDLRRLSRCGHTGGFGRRLSSGRTGRGGACPPRLGAPTGGSGRAGAHPARPLRTVTAL